MTELSLAEKIYAAVRQIPRGKVASYSQIAALDSLENKTNQKICV